MAARKTPSRGGKPDKVWTDAIRVAVFESLKKGGPKKLRLAADKLVALALEGDMAALREIGDRLEGKPTQRVETSGPDGGPVEVRRSLKDLTDEELGQLRAIADRLSDRGPES